MKTYNTTIAAGFGGACYNSCASSYLSSYHSPATILLLIFIREFYIFYLTEQLSENSAENVGCYIVLIITKYLILNRGL